MNALLGLGVVGVILFVILLVIVGPLLGIWALNTLFGLAIPFTVKTWFAAFFLGNAVRATVSTKSE